MVRRDRSPLISTAASDRGQEDGPLDVGEQGLVHLLAELVEARVAVAHAGPQHLRIGGAVLRQQLRGMRLSAEDSAAVQVLIESLDEDGYLKQDLEELRESAASNEGYIEDNLWTGIGSARSGCAARASTGSTHPPSGRRSTRRSRRPAAPPSSCARPRPGTRLPARPLQTSAGIALHSG